MDQRNDVSEEKGRATAFSRLLPRRTKKPDRKFHTTSRFLPRRTKKSEHNFQTPVASNDENDASDTVTSSSGPHFDRRGNEFKRMKATRKIIDESDLTDTSSTPAKQVFLRPPAIYEQQDEQMLQSSRYSDERKAIENPEDAIKSSLSSTHTGTLKKARTPKQVSLKLPAICEQQDGQMPQSSPRATRNVIDKSGLNETSTPKQMALRLSAISQQQVEELRQSSTYSDNDKDAGIPEDGDYEAETVGDMLAESVRSSVMWKSMLRSSASLRSSLRRSSLVASLRRRYSRSFGSAITKSQKARRSAAKKWAESYRTSSSCGRVDETSHFVAQSKWGVVIERWIVPWTPASTESLFVFLFLFNMFQTVPFGFSRMLRGKWVQVYVQQQFVNSILSFLGIKPLFGDNLDGVVYPSDHENPTRPGIDFSIALHLGAGLLWLLIGTTQFASSNVVSRRFHRSFGYLASISFLIHIFSSLYILYKDHVHHHVLTRVVLFQGIVSSTIYVVGAIMAARSGDVETHRDMLVKGYLISAEGSGPIRFTAWIQYIFGHLFLRAESRVWFETSRCQAQFVTAAAGRCALPYIFRLQAMRLLTLYFNVLHLRTPEKARDVTSRIILRKEVYEDAKFHLITMATIIILSQLDLQDWEFMRAVSGKGAPLQLCALTFQTYKMIKSHIGELHQTLLMPRRNAVRHKSATRSANAVVEWAERHGLRDSVPATSRLIIMKEE